MTKKPVWKRAVVQSVHEEGRHGPWAVTTCHGIKGSVTISLNPPVWKERENPKPGNVVLLKDIREKTAGYYAVRARFSRPEDM